MVSGLANLFLGEANGVRTPPRKSRFPSRAYPPERMMLLKRKQSIQFVAF